MRLSHKGLQRQESLLSAQLVVIWTFTNTAPRNNIDVQSILFPLYLFLLTVVSL
jgi:hypothetical protein